MVYEVNKNKELFLRELSKARKQSKKDLRYK